MGIRSVPLQNAIQKQLDATLAAGATSLTLNEDVSSLFSGVSATNPGTLVVDRIDSNGNVTTDGSREYITFTGVSTTTLTGLTRNADSSSSDQEHAVGAIVEFVPDVLWAGSIKSTFETEHAAAGTHGDVTAVTLSAPTITASLANIDVINAATITASSLRAAQANVDTVIPITTNADLNLKPNGTGNVVKPASLIHYVIEYSTALTTGDNKHFYTIPKELNGLKLNNVHARLISAPSGAPFQAQLHNVTLGVDILAIPIFVDAGELASNTSATLASINASYSTVSTNDLIRLDIDQVGSSYAGAGLILRTGYDFS